MENLLFRIADWGMDHPHAVIALLVASAILAAVGRVLVAMGNALERRR